MPCNFLEQFLVISPLIRKVPSPMNLFVLIAVVGALYFTRDICIPFLLAGLLSFVLSPLVSQLQKWRVPRVPAAFLVVGMLFALLASSAWMVGGQVLSLAGKLPQYQA